MGDVTQAPNLTVRHPTGDQPPEERGVGAGLQAETHPAAEPGARADGAAAWEAGGPGDERLGRRVGSAAAQGLGNGLLGPTGEYLHTLLLLS